MVGKQNRCETFCQGSHCRSFHRFFPFHFVALSWSGWTFTALEQLSPFHQTSLIIVLLTSHAGARSLPTSPMKSFSPGSALLCPSFQDVDVF